MPVITINMVPVAYEKKAEVAKVFSEELSRIAGAPKEAVTILFYDVPPENAAHGGELLAEVFKRR